MAKEHPHTRAVGLVNDEMAKVIASFKDGPKFMQTPVSAKTQARRDRIANAPSHIRDLMDQGYTQEFVDRLAKLTREGQ